MLIVQNAIMESTSFEIEYLREHLEKIGEEEGMDILRSIVFEPEIVQVILNAVSAMMDDGITGVQSDAARMFYVYAMSLELKSEEINPGSVKPISTPASESSKSFLPRSQATEVCTTYPTTCSVGRCPGSDRCFGMCGRGCTCWSYLCGDCCKQTGCIQHDQCCRTGGFFAFLKCYIPIGFTCSESYTC